MSALSTLYDRERSTGCSHRAALRHLARRIGVDQDTLLRQLHRADPRKFPLTTTPKETTRR